MPSYTLPRRGETGCLQEVQHAPALFSTLLLEEGGCIASE